jgi:hypothetical protein
VQADCQVKLPFQMMLQDKDLSRAEDKTECQGDSLGKVKED